MKNLLRGNNVIIKGNCILGNNVVLGDNVFIDYNCIIRDNVTIKDNTVIGANCILGEYKADWYEGRCREASPLFIGRDSIVRSNSIIYEDCHIGDNFQSGHHVTIREGSKIGLHCSMGTLSDVQGDCEIGDYVRCHSNVHIGQKTLIKNYVWVFPYVIFTNDPTPPSESLKGVVVEEYAVIATGSILLPGIHVESDSLVAAGAVVTKDVLKNQVVGGNPARVISSTDRIKNRETGESVYPWQYSFDRNMPWRGMNYNEWKKMH